MSSWGLGIGAHRRRVGLLTFVVACLGASSAAADYPRVDLRLHATTVFPANRPFDLPIDSVMVHDTEESYAGMVKTFTDKEATAAVQYAVTGEAGASDPAVTQFAEDKNWTRSVNNWWYNQTSIGVEHIGFAAAPAGYYTQEMYQRSADLIGWVVWKYRVPLDRAHILGHDNIPNTVDNAVVQHWDPGPSWDWPYYWSLIKAAYKRWSHNAPTPPAEIPKPYTKLDPKIRMISVGDDFDSAADAILWTTGLQNGFANVYAGRGGRPEPETLVRGASDPSTYTRSPGVGKPPAWNKLDFSCDNLPWSMVPNDNNNAPFTVPVSQVSIGDLRAKAAWGQAFALLGTRKVDGVRYDRINFNGTVGWVRDSDTVDGWGALVRFRGGSAPTTLFSGPEYPTTYLGKVTDTRICPDRQYGFTRAGQTYVSRLRRFSQGKFWYQIDYNHRVAWVPEDEVTISGTRPPVGRG